MSRGLLPRSAAIWTFSYTVRFCSRLYCWKMNPRCSRRKRVSWSSDMSVRHWSRNMMVPELTVSRPLMTFSRVLFPLPLGPRMTTNSPSSIVRSTARRAIVSTSPLT